MKKKTYEVGSMIAVNMHDVIADPKNKWMLGQIKSGVLSKIMHGVIMRIADNGKIGVEFGIKIMQDKDTASMARDLHGKGQSGFCLYVQPEYIVVQRLCEQLPEPREEIRPQGDIAQSMEDTMLDEEYGMDEDEYMDIVGF